MHNFIFLLAAALLVLSLFLVRDVPRKTVAYGQEELKWQSQYIKQFDAFLKGQLHIDIEPSARLAALENPYDPAEREGVSFLWDHAYYGGKYYSYFGAAPLLTVYLPVYLASGELPDDAMACFILSIFAVTFAALAYREAVLRFCKKVNIFLFLAGLCAFIAVSGVHTGVFCSDVYYIPVLSALGCSQAFVFFALRAVRKHGLAERRLILFLAALALVLAVLSRPTAALMCAAVFPVFADLLGDIKRETKRKSLTTACFFLVPLALGAGLVMWYNAARFSSPFDFGESYQLTVSDISKNGLEADFLFPSVFSYFLYPFWSKDVYPYVTMYGGQVLPDGARYVYGDIYVGAFAFVLPAAVMLYPRLARAGKAAGARTRVQTAFAFCTAGLALTVAFLDFCKG
ncbi:MAG: hypothetical protein IJW21_08645, partial [Clostridia bacterium]|nr:hypothetical protein [Clostridia bacterium]